MYQIRRDAAIKAILDDWQVDQKMALIKIVGGGRKSYGDETGLESLLRETAVAFEFADFGWQCLEDLRGPHACLRVRLSHYAQRI